MGLNEPGSREHGSKKAIEQGAWNQKNNRIQGALKILLGSGQKNNLGSREPRCYF